ncbi:hypothetical protein DMN91_007440, partial [Ooceraea biroi]
MRSNVGTCRNSSHQFL